MGIFEFIYYLGYSVKKHYSLKNQKCLPHKVISVGNITTGGTGKTPCVIALAEEAKTRGFSPVILTRGYKGKAKGPCFVSPSASGLPNLCTSALDAGDEPVLMAERLKDVPVVKCADRYKGGIFALENLRDPETWRRGDAEIKLLSDSPIHPLTHSPILFILDDGFQHWRLFRDKDILLIDAENPFGNGSLLPVGYLREPLREIKRADIIVITRTENAGRTDLDSLTNEIRRHNKNAPVFHAGHKLSGFINPAGETLPVEWAAGKNFFGFCGIGNPDSFEKTVLSTGANLKGFKKFRDHYNYRQGDINAVLRAAKRRNSDWIVTTEKDIMRLNRHAIPENLVAVAIEFSVAGNFYDEVFRGI